MQTSYTAGLLFNLYHTWVCFNIIPSVEVPLEKKQTTSDDKDTGCSVKVDLNLTDSIINKQMYSIWYKKKTKVDRTFFDKPDES